MRSPLRAQHSYDRFIRLFAAPAPRIHMDRPMRVRWHLTRPGGVRRTPSSPRRPGRTSDDRLSVGAHHDVHAQYECPDFLRSGRSRCRTGDGGDRNARAHDRRVFARTTVRSPSTQHVDTPSSFKPAERIGQCSPRQRNRPTRAVSSNVVRVGTEGSRYGLGHVWLRKAGRGHARSGERAHRSRDIDHSAPRHSEAFPAQRSYRNRACTATR
jgi:hypothetical protein